MTWERTAHRSVFRDARFELVAYEYDGRWQASIARTTKMRAPPEPLLTEEDALPPEWRSTEMTPEDRYAI